MKEEVAHEPVVQYASIGVPCGDVDTTVKETGRKEVQKWTKQVLLKAWMGIKHDLRDQAFEEVKEKSLEM